MGLRFLFFNDSKYHGDAGKQFFFIQRKLYLISNIVLEKLFVVTIVKNLSENYNNIVFSPQLLTRLIINEVKEKCHNRNTRAPENDRPTFNIQMK